MARLLVVTALAVVAFVVAIFSFQEVPASECQVEAERDPSYQVTLEPAVDVNLTSYVLNVNDGGQPITGAQVCMRADMGGAGNMSGMGTSALAREVGAGRYEINIRFEMAGHWQGHVVVREPEEPPVEVPLDVEAN